MTIEEQLHAKQAEMRMRMFAGIGGSFEKAEPVYDENLFEKAECYMDDFLIEKAKRQVGETKEINGKTYVWSEYQPGKYDWKVANKKKAGGEEVGEQSQPKSLADHAKGTSTDTLKKVANSSNAPQKLKDAAKKELARRSKGENGSDMAEKQPVKSIKDICRNIENFMADEGNIDEATIKTDLQQAVKSKGVYAVAKEMVKTYQSKEFNNLKATQGQSLFSDEEINDGVASYLNQFGIKLDDKTKKLLGNKTEDDHGDQPSAGKNKKLAQGSASSPEQRIAEIKKIMQDDDFSGDDEHEMNEIAHNIQTYERIYGTSLSKREIHEMSDNPGYYFKTDMIGEDGTPDHNNPDVKRYLKLDKRYDGEERSSMSDAEIKEMTDLRHKLELQHNVFTNKKRVDMMRKSPLLAKLLDD